jgi:ABC-type uncharacterized transport system ATPase subunit
VQALSDVSVDLGTGEILALVGENGAGKSTLMNVLYGLYPQDTGEVWLDGMQVKITSPRDAIGLGIGMVHQHFMLSPSLTVAENIVLGNEPKRRGLFDVARAEREVLATAEANGFRIDPRAKVKDISVGSQQRVEIVKALHRQARVLILDEPTAVLTPQEATELLAALRKLRAEGRTIVLITHKLKEVMDLADRIVVLRRGKKVLETKPSETNPQQLAFAMVGENANRPPVVATPVPADAPSALEVHDVTTVGSPGRIPLKSVSLKVAAGEILGIAGVDGNGQRELVEGIVGLRPFASGRVVLRGQDLSKASVEKRRSQGLAYIPEDRLHEAILGEMTVEENYSLGHQRRAPFAKGPWIDFSGRSQAAQTMVTSFDVRPPTPAARIGALSGGNQQKVVVARELFGQVSLLVAVQPTRGLDLGAVSDVHTRLAQAKAAGVGIVLVSLDLDELLAVSDRVVVLCLGAVAGSQVRGAYDERTLGRWMLGASDA